MARRGKAKKLPRDDEQDFGDPFNDIWLASSDDDLAELVPHRAVWDRISIELKSGGYAPYKENVFQREVSEIVRTNRRKRKPTYLIIVKGRQLGASTGSAAINVGELTTQPGVRGIVVTYKQGKHENLPIAEIYHTMLKTDPTYEENPPLQHSVGHWKGANGSDLEFHLAGEELARGPHYRLLHGTEVDFWPNFNKTMKSLMQAMADDWRTIVILETTLGDRPSPGFRDLIQRCVRGQEQDFQVVFQKWYLNEGYHAGNPANTFEWNDEIEAHLVATMDDTEKKLHHEIGVPLAALQYRRRIIPLKCQNNPQTFAEEYPSTIQEALAYRGSWWFKRTGIEFLETKICEPRSLVSFHLDAMTGSWGVIPTRDKSMAVRIWEPPTVQRRYQMGVDVANTATVKSSRSDISLIDLSNGRVVGRWSGQVQAYHVARMAHCLAMYYGGGSCEVVYDRTGVGAALEGEFLRLRTPNVRAGQNKQMGIILSRDIRAAILGNLQNVADACAIITHCAEQIEQMKMFTGASDQGWCDAVFSLALACYGTDYHIWLQNAPDQIITPNGTETKHRELTLDDLLKIAEDSARGIDNSRGMVVRKPAGRYEYR